MGCHYTNEQKRYRVLTRSSDGWWGFQREVWASDADEAADAYVNAQGINPPNEIAIQSMTMSSKDVFKIYRVKPRAAYELEVV